MSERGEPGELSERREPGFEIYPAIDVRAGRCVRLRQGDFAAETVYDDDPVAVARSFDAAGARWLHVVDLDAARDGEATNLPIVAEVVRAFRGHVQCGGGVRSSAAAGALLDVGVARVVVGTAAIEDPDLLAALCATHPGRVAAGLDARGRDVAVRGWRSGTGVDLLDALERVTAAGAAAVVVTEIGRDGMLTGPALDQLGAVLEVAVIPVLASGGVGSLADVASLAALDVNGRRLAGVVVGRALYEGRFGLAEALALARV